MDSRGADEGRVDLFSNPDRRARDRQKFSDRARENVRLDCRLACLDLARCRRNGAGFEQFERNLIRREIQRLLQLRDLAIGLPVVDCALAAS